MKSPVETYILRIYRCGGGAKRHLVGLIEAPRASESRGFTSVEQLWDILASRVPARRKGAHEASALAPGRLRDALSAETIITDRGGKLEL